MLSNAHREVGLSGKHVILLNLSVLVGTMLRCNPACSHATSMAPMQSGFLQSNRLHASLRLLCRDPAHNIMQKSCASRSPMCYLVDLVSATNSFPFSCPPTLANAHAALALSYGLKSRTCSFAALASTTNSSTSVCPSVANAHAILA